MNNEILASIWLLKAQLFHLARLFSDFSIIDVATQLKRQWPGYTFPQLHPLNQRSMNPCWSKRARLAKKWKQMKRNHHLIKKVWVPQRSGERRQKVAMLWAAKLCRQRLEAEDQEKSWHRWPSAVKSVCNANITAALDRQPTGRLSLQKQKREPKYGQGN